MRTLAILLICLPVAAQTLPGDDYSVSGVVVDHLTNRPLNHALVELSRIGKGGGDASVITEADGHFNFVHVPKGKYNLQAQKRGQFPQGYHAGDGGFATAIVVDGHLKTDGIVFPLKSPASINGLLIGDDGDPVANAQIHLFREGVTEGEVQTTQAGITNSNSSGQFHFGHLEAGKYYLAAQGSPWYNEAGAPSVYPVTFYGDTSDVTATRPLSLTEGAQENVQIVLHLVSAIHIKVLNNRRNFMLFVPGPGGTQIPVSYTSVVNAGTITINKALEIAEPVTFNISNISAGRYQISSVINEGKNGQQALSPRTLDLAEGSTINLDGAEAAASLTGRIVFDQPRPPGDLHVFLSGPQNRRADVAADGTFKFDNVATGKYNLTLLSPLVEISSLEAKGARATDDRLEILNAGSVEVVAHAQASESMPTIEGFAVRGETGVPGALVLLLPEDTSRTRLIRRDQSDGDGSFTLPKIRPGHYTLVAIDDGSQLAYKDAKIMAPYQAQAVAITVPLKSNQPIHVPVQPRVP